MSVARAGQLGTIRGYGIGSRRSLARMTSTSAIVSLSRERTVEDYRDILRDAKRVRTAALYLGAREDSLTDGTRQQRQLHAAMGGELLQVDGFGHGTELLESPAVTTRVLDFIGHELR